MSQLHEVLQCEKTVFTVYLVQDQDQVIEHYQQTQPPHAPIPVITPKVAILMKSIIII